MVEIAVHYEGGLRCVAEHGPSGATLSTDAPKDNLGKGEAFSPTDLAAASLGVCMLTTMDIVARKNGVEVCLGGARGVVRKHMTSAPPRRIAKIEVELEIPLPENFPRRALLEDAARNCPVALSLHPETEKAITFRWIG